MRLYDRVPGFLGPASNSGQQSTLVKAVIDLSAGASVWIELLAILITCQMNIYYLANVSSVLVNDLNFFS